MFKYEYFVEKLIQLKVIVTTLFSMLKNFGLGTGKLGSLLTDLISLLFLAISDQLSERDVKLFP